MAAQPRQRARDKRRACLVLLSAVLWFLAVQAGLVALVERWDPSLRDPQYGSRLALLRRRLAEAPGRPLVLFMGTSRTLNGIRPSLLPAARAPAAGPVVSFNFGQAASGPLRQVLILRRLFRQGIRPAHIYLEVLPAQCCVPGEAEVLLGQRWPGPGDWQALKHYWPAARSCWRWWGESLLPCVSLHDRLAGRLLPWLLPNWARPGRGDGSEAEDDGFFGYGDNLSAEARACWQTRIRTSMAPWLHTLPIRTDPDRALRHFLTLCRRQQVRVSLLLLPEGSACRGWYSPLALGRLENYLNGIRREFGVDVVDARRWVDDEDFLDSMHLLPRGADVFTRRFGRQVYLPRLRRWQVKSEEPCTRTNPAEQGPLEAGRAAVGGGGHEAPCCRR